MLTYLAANQILNNLVGRTLQINLASSCYVGLAWGDPGRDASTFQEVPTEYTSGGVTRSTGYERQYIGYYNAQPKEDFCKMTNASNGATHNQDIIYFPEVLDVSDVPGLTPEQIEHPWGTIGYLCIFSSKTGSAASSLLAYSPIVRWDEQQQEYVPTTITPEVGQLPLIRKDQFRLELE